MACIPQKMGEFKGTLGLSGLSYLFAEKQGILILDARKRILEVEHPNTIRAMANLAATYKNLGKYKETEKMEIQAQEVKTRVIGTGSHYTIATVANVQEAQEP